jgi:hypothetical protein
VAGAGEIAGRVVRDVGLPVGVPPAGGTARLKELFDATPLGVNSDDNSLPEVEKFKEVIHRSFVELRDAAAAPKAHSPGKRALLTHLRTRVVLTCPRAVTAWTR